MGDCTVIKKKIYSEVTRSRRLITDLKFTFSYRTVLNIYCSARDWERSGLLGGIPRVVVQISALLYKGHCRCTRAYVTKRNSGMKRVKCG